ncbi:uncharacterized protein LOC114286296 [Camellia sinensis]|uniref:uncharacterized protein LOC114286296 n=1 Tax=Camellia sinensis TaxID=4442 RepID=UPI0010358F3B|nr:uncharacterized protein LOC114286296 [Camellia sinensis]
METPAKSSNCWGLEGIEDGEGIKKTVVHGEGSMVYWSSLFILPKKIIRAIETLFKSFFWSGCELRTHGAKVSWENICYPKNEGGLGWPVASSWELRELIESTPSTLHPNNGLDSARWLPSSDGKFFVTSTWNYLRKSGDRMSWAAILWGPHNIPKASFVTWMAILGRLNTRDRLRLFGISQSAECVFCNDSCENHNHLFFDYPFSARIWTCIQSKLNVSWPVSQWPGITQHVAQSTQGCMERIIFECCEILYSGPSAVRIYIVCLCNYTAAIVYFLLLYIWHFWNSCIYPSWAGSAKFWKLVARRDSCFRHLECEESFYFNCIYLLNPLYYGTVV